MKNLVFEKYQIEIQEFERKCSIEFDNEKGLAFKKERRKIYLVCHKEQVFYVGEANSSIKKRFKNACDSYNLFVDNKTKGGYKGYKWLNPLNNKEKKLNLYVVIFGEEYNLKEKRQIVEAIEGELVFEVRCKTGNWPDFQNEIHFSNHANTNKTAQNILKEFGLLQNKIKVDENT